MKSVKRAIGENNVLAPRSKVLVPITFSAPHFSAALSIVLSKLEKKFSTKVVIVKPNGIDIDGKPNDWPPSNSEIMNVDIEVDRLNVQSLSSCLDFDRLWSIDVADRLKINVIALPYTRTDLIIFALNALLIDGLEAMLNALDYFEIDNIKVFSGFSKIEGEVVSTYVVLKKLWFYSSLCNYKIPAKKVFYSVAQGRPELEFSKEKALDKLLALARNKLKERYLKYSVAGIYRKQRFRKECSYRILNLNTLE